MKQVKPAGPAKPRKPDGAYAQAAALFRAAVCTSFAVFFVAGQSTSAIAAMAPANAIIGNQASATYVDSTSTSRTSTSNTVQTTVLAVKSFTLTSNGARNAPPMHRFVTRTPSPIRAMVPTLMR